MIANFLNNEYLYERFRLNFLYAFSKKYEEGLKKRVYNNKAHISSFQVLDLYKSIEKLGSHQLRTILKALYYVFFLRYFEILANIIKVYPLLKKFKPDILHINNGGYPGAYSCMAVVFAARLMGVKNIIYIVNNIAVNYKRPSRWIDYPLDILIKRSVTLFITGSHYAGSALKRVLNLPDKKLISIHNGINVRKVTSEKQEFIKKYRIPDSTLLIGIVAVLEERKGHIYFLQACQLLKKQNSLLPFVIIEGRGTQAEILKDFVHNNELEEHFMFLEEEPEIFNLMNAMDIMVLPSIDQEDFPNIILESMSLGKAVIASEIAGIPEQIEHMKSGIIVKPCEPESLAQAIQLLFDNNSLREELGNNAKERFYNNFVSDISVKNYEKLYQSLLTQK